MCASRSIWRRGSSYKCAPRWRCGARLRVWRAGWWPCVAGSGSGSGGPGIMRSSKWGSRGASCVTSRRWIARSASCLRSTTRSARARSAGRSCACCVGRRRRRISWSGSRWRGSSLRVSSRARCARWIGARASRWTPRATRKSAWVSCCGSRRARGRAGGARGRWRIASPGIRSRTVRSPRCSPRRCSRGAARSGSRRRQSGADRCYEFE